MSKDTRSHPTTPRGMRLWLEPKRLGSLVAGCAILVGLGISCGTVQRTVSVPLDIPGATFVGTTGCADCHDLMVRDFVTASHAGLMAEGENALDVGCESCHGPGSLHYDSAEPDQIINPGDSPSVCFQCHLQTRGEFRLPNRHPVKETGPLGELSGASLTCIECHDPHKGPGVRGRGTDLLTENESCLRCHDAQRGPFVFEHEAMREGCTLCHQPHGSVNAKLLNQRGATLCLRCHFQQQRPGGQILIGGWDHTLLLPQGTCWSAGCHEAMHGSQVSSSLRY